MKSRIRLAGLLALLAMMPAPAPASEKATPQAKPGPIRVFNNAETYFLVGNACGEAMKKLVAAKGRWPPGEWPRDPNGKRTA